MEGFCRLADASFHILLRGPCQIVRITLFFVSSKHTEYNLTCHRLKLAFFPFSTNLLCSRLYPATPTATWFCESSVNRIALIMPTFQFFFHNYFDLPLKCGQNFPTEFGDLLPAASKEKSHVEEKNMHAHAQIEKKGG